MRVSILKPGLLIALSVRVNGGVQYRRNEIEPERADGEGGRVAKWETEKYIANAEEYERATQARSKARSLVSSVCAHSAFGMLCPQDREAQLREAVDEARRVAAAFNATAAGSRVEVFVLVGRIAQTDEEAARALGAEVRDLLTAMAEGVKAADPEQIREAATKAKQLGAMLSEGVAGKVTAAVDEARKAAREIVRRIETKGEESAKVVAELKLRALEEARFAFLDLDEAPQAAPAAIEGRSLDMEAAAPVSAAPAPQFGLEL